MEFRVLGPLEVTEDGRTRELGGPKQRALLALLLLNANRIVPSVRLIDDLWDDDPPGTAAATLHVYVSRLRKAVGADRVATRAGGYALRVERGELDLDRFADLSAEGREALATGDPARAARALRDAASLWRGPALADVAAQRWAQPDVARLEDARLAVEEDRIEADLALGRHAEVAGELEALVERHPLRERPRMQLMLALYRSGRQAEALEEYGRARRALVDGLGVEPSAPLQLLERRILNQDPGLDAPALPPARARGAPADRGERAVVTVVFADLGVSMPPVGDPERVAAFIADVRETAAGRLELAGGTVERGIADAVLAVFGLPPAQDDHAVRAADAALAVLEALDDRFGSTVAPRVGVETGEVVVERTGHVVGEPVMAAGALLRRARPGEALAGPRAAASARAGFALRRTPHGFLLAGRRVAAAERERRPAGPTR